MSVVGADRETQVEHLGLRVAFGALRPKPQNDPYRCDHLAARGYVAICACSGRTCATRNVFVRVAFFHADDASRFTEARADRRGGS